MPEQQLRLLFRHEHGHAAGVRRGRALAWAVDPNATVAQVRNAILHGADQVAALSGKVASGGRLDAYNTLQLLGPSRSRRGRWSRP